MIHDNKFIIFLVLVFGIFGAMPLALATTAQVIIMPGSGSGQNCEQTSTCFSPSLVNISSGDTVTWTNNDNMAHSLTDGLPYGNKTGILFSSGPISPASTYSFTFHNPGTYRYFATDTKWMVGEVIVGPPEASPAVPEFGTLSYVVLLISVLSIIVFSVKFRLQIQ